MKCKLPHCKSGPTDYSWPDVKPQQDGIKGETTKHGQWKFDGKEWQWKLAV